MTEESARRDIEPATAVLELSWLESLRLPALTVRAQRIEGANAAALAEFGDATIGSMFDRLLRPLRSASETSEQAASSKGQRVEVRRAAATGRQYSLHRQEGAEPGEEIVVLFEVTRAARIERALTRRLSEVTRAHRSGRVSSWEIDLRRLRVSVPNRVSPAFGEILRTIDLKDAMELVHPDDLGAVKNAIRRAIEGAPLQVEARVIDLQGKEHWTLFRGSVAYDPSGEPVRLSGVAIGQRGSSQGERNLEEQLEQQLALLDHLADGVVRVAEDGAIIAINSAAERMTRWRSDEALGHPVENVVHLIDDRTGVRVTRPLAAAAGDNEQATNSRLMRRDGTELPVRCEVRRLDVEAGAPIWVIEMRDLSELRGLESQMLFRATHDGLTGLFDRVEFERRLGEALVEAREDDHTHALCYVDLDNFKIINDTCGHLAGDEMLKQIGSLLRCNFRGSDTLGRLGGDEFGILLSDCPLAKANGIAQTLCQDIKMFRFSWDDKVFNVTASVGLVSIDGQTASVAEVLGAADGACYIAKQNGANRVEVYRPDDTVLSERRDQLQLIQVVQNALATDSFELYGQPIQPLYGGERHIIELLLRMRDENNQMVMPGEFMRVAEVHGLAVMIDRWVVRQALKELAGDGDGGGYGDVVFAVNLSGQSLGDEAFLQYVLEQF